MRWIQGSGALDERQSTDLIATRPPEVQPAFAGIEPGCVRLRWSASYNKSGCGGSIWAKTLPYRVPGGGLAVGPGGFGAISIGETAGGRQRPLDCTVCEGHGRRFTTARRHRARASSSSHGVSRQLNFTVAKAADDPQPETARDGRPRRDAVAPAERHPRKALAGKPDLRRLRTRHYDADT
jgi:hypothetical protein